MGNFFAQPNLDNLQFKQLTSSELKLCGQTKIATTSGLTLSNGVGGYVPIIATGGTNNKVLTYLNGNIVLRPTTGGGNMVYTGASPTTCTVGGLPAGCAIYNQSISTILEQILVPTINPVVTGPVNSSFTLSPPTTIYEVGTCVTNICATSCFSRGSVAPQYNGGSPYRSGLPNTYNYIQLGGICAATNSTALCNCYLFTPSKIQVGNNVVSTSITYSSGSTPVYNSACSVWLTALPSGTTSPSLSYTICGLYPYYWGNIASGGSPAGGNRPLINKYLVTGGTKVVDFSSDLLLINFNSTSDDYIWFAIPSESASKTKWYVDALNNGIIGGGVNVGGNLFPDFVVVNDVASTTWSSVIGGSPHSYKVYVSNYQTALNTIIEFKNI